jgi:DNA invertase Pin-like site-specific DNA recombinase
MAAALQQIPVAQYLRMPTGLQEYSSDNQSQAIDRYAESHGFTRKTSNKATRSRTQNEFQPPALPLVPAAQYVRMSDDAQQYSIDNQKEAIQEYAAHHRFTIVKTYTDSAKSGVVGKRRAALRELLKDVVGGNPGFRAVLVYDVSRWGRYPNNDEAAYYEFLCHRSGTPLHYCAETFANDGSVSRNS